MANRTAKDAQTVKGTNPQFLVEKIIRLRVYDCKYWKEECFGLTGMLCIKGYVDSGLLAMGFSVEICGKLGSTFCIMFVTHVG